MQVRGAPLIGVTAAYGVCLALRADASDEALDRAIALLAEQRPTADQPALGARGDARRRAQPAAPSSASPRPTRAPPRSATRTWRPTARIGEHGLELIRDDRRAQEAGRARQRADPLQRRLARLRRLAARRPRRSTQAHDARHPAARVGGRDAAAQPGRRADRLRARRPRRAAHHHRRQCRRPSDAARAGRYRASSAPTASPPTATSPTRSAPISRRWRPRTTACRSTWRCRIRPSTGRSPTARDIPIEERGADEVLVMTRAPPGRHRWWRSRSPPPAARRATTPST